MNIEVVRTKFGGKATLGKMSIDGIYECVTLEDVVRPDGVKIPGATAIPAGKYRVTIDPSSRFDRPMPHILDVPNFEGIRIHSGNTDLDTEGCILLGQSVVNDDFISNSRIAFAAFFPKLEAAIAAGEKPTIVITNGNIVP